MSERFERTGEFRPPKKGEWYESEVLWSKGTPRKSHRNWGDTLESHRHILRRVEDDEPSPAQDFGEPWELAHGVILNAKMKTVAMCANNHDEAPSRIVACVNACVGMADPQAEIDGLRENLRQSLVRIGHYQDNQEERDAFIDQLHDSKDAEIERLRKQVAKDRYFIGKVLDLLEKDKRILALQAILDLRRDRSAAAAECMAWADLQDWVDVLKARGDDWIQDAGYKRRLKVLFDARTLTDRRGGPETWVQKEDE